MNEKHTLVMDLEVYTHYFLIRFKSTTTRKGQVFELRRGLDVFDRDKVLAILRQYRIVTFNGLDFDMPLLFYVLALLKNYDPFETSVTEIMRKAKGAADHIIDGRLRHWQFASEYGIEVPNWLDHIDLKEPVPGVQISLKLYGGRLHSQKLQDLPIPPEADLTDGSPVLVDGVTLRTYEEKCDALSTYCDNDLDTTIDLWKRATDPKDNIIETRELLTAEFGIDVRSKSDAQIAEAIIRSRVEKLKGERIYKPDVKPGTRYKYQPPAWMRFHTPLLREMFAKILATDFVVQHDGTIAMPKTLEGARLTIGRSTYSMGIGGLHSTEKSQGIIATENLLLRDVDVTSYYPALILQCGLFPTNMGDLFQRVFNDFFVRRVAAKKAGQKSTAQTLKIFLNGTFGKLGSPYSVLYAPNLLIQVTVTGQLALLMLIEQFEMHGIPVVSANTDGVVQACPAHLDRVRQQIVKDWEKATGFETEETKYRALFSRDVNNYVALKDGKGYKTKGILAEPGVMKNPQNVIVNDAVCKLLDEGVPIAETILGCRDIRKFLTVKRVTGGGIFPKGTQTVDDWVEIEPRKWVRQAWIDSGEVHTKPAVERKSRPHPVEDFVGPQYLGKVVRWYRSRKSSVPILYGDGAKKHHRVGGSDNAMPCMNLPEQLPDDIDYGFYINEAHDLLREIGAVK